MTTAQVKPSPPSSIALTPRRIVVIESATLLMLIGLAVWKGLIPGWKILGTDFPNYYVAARLIREHYCLDRIYDWLWFQRMADRFGVGRQLVGFLGLTPFSALPIIPFSWLPVLEAKRCWIVCNIAMLAAAAHLLSRQSRLSPRRAWLVVLFAVIPLRTGFLFGQMHILVLVLLVAAYLWHMRGGQILSGCCIGLAAALKIYPAFFCAYFLLKRRFSALAAALASIALCVLASYLTVGRTAMCAYLFQQLPRSLQGESGNPFLASLTSSSAMFHRLFLYEPELNPQPLVSSPWLYAFFYPLWQATLAGIVLCRLRGAFRPDRREALDWSQFLCLLMFLSSAPASYQFVVLIAAAVPTIHVLLDDGRRRAAALYLLLYIAACNVRTIGLGHPVSIFTPFLYLKLWCGVALIAFYPLILGPSISTVSLKVHRIQTVALALGLWVVGSAGAWLHLRGMHPGGALPVIRSDAAYVRIDPVSTNRGLFYIAMLEDGYRVQITKRDFSEVYGGGEPATSELSFTSARSGENIWIEESSGTSSALIHFAAGKPATSCRIEDAETPALSLDQSTLAFIREDHGHGSLWALDLNRCVDSGATGAVRLTPAAFDVRTVTAGDEGTFLIGAIYRGKQRVFGISGGMSPQLLAEGKGALDAPALSPDGKVLAVRELIAQRWQLMSFDLSSHRWQQLTHADCNAYAPSWKDDRTVLYATDCMRGMGFSTLASLGVSR